MGVFSWQRANSGTMEEGASNRTADRKTQCQGLETDKEIKKGEPKMNVRNGEGPSPPRGEASRSYRAVW